MFKKLILASVLVSGISYIYAVSETAIFAAGCFWSAQSDFDSLPGVTNTVVGYDGGTTPNPNYEEVSAGKTTYAESIKVTFDNSKVTYAQVLDFFWHHIDPTVSNVQFCDSGPQYRSSIFYLNDHQKKQAMASIHKVRQRFPQVYTEIMPSTTFYPAEEYHQDYYKKNSTRYHMYRWNCGRDDRLKEVWSAK